MNPTMEASAVRWPVTVRRVASAELIKLGSLRTHVWLLAVAAAAVAFLGPIQAIGQVLGGSQGGGEGVDTGVDSGAVSTALTGASLGTLLFGVLGVLTVTGEYAPRAIRTTFTLVPRRGHVVLAKALSLVLVTAVLSVFAVVAAAAMSLAILSQGDADGSSPHLFRVSAAMVWYLVGWGVLGQAAGWLTRSKIGGAALLMSVMLILAPVLGLVPGRAGELLVALMPSSAGGAMISTQHATALGAPTAGFLLWTVYLIGFTALSAWVVSRRDA